MGQLWFLNKSSQITLIYKEMAIYVWWGIHLYRMDWKRSILMWYRLHKTLNLLCNYILKYHTNTLFCSFLRLLYFYRKKKNSKFLFFFFPRSVRHQTLKNQSCYFCGRPANLFLQLKQGIWPANSVLRHSPSFKTRVYHFEGL